MNAFLALVAFSAATQVSAATVFHGDTRRYDDLIVEHSRRNGLDPRLVKAVIAAESQFHPRAVSRAGARGLMQLMPSTAREMGTSPARLHDPEKNIEAGTAYLAVLFRAALRARGMKGVRAKEAPRSVIRKVVAAYNCGPSCLGARKWPAETRAYVRRVLEYHGSNLTWLGRPDEAPPMVAGKRSPRRRA